MNVYELAEKILAEVEMMDEYAAELVIDSIVSICKEVLTERKPI